MTIVLFLVVLAVLIFVHELGHFLIAKKSGIRVDEFAIGFPPKIYGWQKGETKYVINLIPFGGYVKIFGENPDEESISGPDCQRSFINVSKWKQVAVLIAGVAFNIIFAWLLISASFMMGSLVPVGEGTDNSYAQYIKETNVVITSVAKSSPAELAGLKTGDKLLSVEGVVAPDLTVTKVRELIEKSPDHKIDLKIKRGSESKDLVIETKLNEKENRQIIGIFMENVGVARFGFFSGLWEGAKQTVQTLKAVAVGLGTFIGQAFQGKGDFSQVSGPVGIVGMVGNAADFGSAYLLGFVAFISLNLAVINLVPFPALDGGRVLFVLIEAITRRQIKPRIANIINTVGFAILIILMLVITYRDIAKLF